MRQKNEPKNKPLYRLSFARRIGADDKSGEQIGSAREIGSIWPRRDGKGMILRFDHIPIELTQHQGVCFVYPTDAAEADGGY